MALRLDEIAPGVVAYLSGAALVSDLRVWQPYPNFEFKEHPFVCIAAKHGRSVWLTLTSRQHSIHRRPEVLPHWRGGGTTGWRTRSQFVNNVTSPFCGPDEAFVDASSGEVLIGNCDRPRISATGIEAITAAMTRHNPISRYLADPEWAYVFNEMFSAECVA